MNDLTQEEAQKFFNQVSVAMKDDDITKMSDLYKEEPAPDAKKEDVVDPPVDDPKVDEQPDPDKQPDDPAKDDQPDGKEKDDDKNSPPDVKADEAPEKKELTPEEKKIAELEAQLSTMRKETHALKSQAGRVPSVQRRITELTKKLDELSKPSPSSQTSTKIEPKLTELLKGLKETDSDLADTIAKAIKEATNAVDEEALAREKASLEFHRDQEIASYREQEKNRLLDMYPNAPQVFQSKHWTEWKSVQPKGILALAESSNADEVGYAFRKYAEDMVAQYPDLAKKPDDKAPEPDAAAAEKAKKIEEERARKKENAANVGSPNGAGKQAMPDDPEALFQKISLELQKERLGK